MKNIYKRVLMAAAIVVMAALSGCSDDGDYLISNGGAANKLLDYTLERMIPTGEDGVYDYEVVEVDPSEGVLVDFIGDKYRLTAKFDSRWNLEIPYYGRSWISYDQSSGVSDAEIILDINANEFFTKRSCQLKLVSYDGSVEVDFTQKAAPEELSFSFDDTVSLKLSWNEPDDIPFTINATLTPTDGSSPIKVVDNIRLNSNGKQGASSMDIYAQMTADQKRIIGTLSVTIHNTDTNEQLDYFNAYFPFGGGDGSVGSPFKVANMRHLSAIAQSEEFLSKHYEQTALIDCSAGGISTPIGSFAKPFTGSYNGNFNYINYLTVAENSMNVGMFGYIKGATISNVKLVAASITGNVHVGGVVGYAEGECTISGCSVSGEVTGYGVAACNGSGNISSTMAPMGYVELTDEREIAQEGSESDADVKSYGVGGVGGIVGTAIASTEIDNGSGAWINITDCYTSVYTHGRGEAFVNVEGSSLNYGRYGGIVGYARNNVNVARCISAGQSGGYYATGVTTNVQRSDVMVGGIVATAYNRVNITDCQNNGLVCGSGFSGGVLGYGCNNITLRRCSVDNLGDTNKYCALAGNSGVLVGVVHGSNNLIAQCYANMEFVGGPTFSFSTFAGYLVNTDVAYCYAVGGFEYTAAGANPITVGSLIGNVSVGDSSNRDVNIYSCFVTAKYTYFNNLAPDINNYATLMFVNSSKNTAGDKSVKIKSVAVCDLNDSSLSYPTFDVSGYGANTDFVDYATPRTFATTNIEDLYTEEFVTTTLGDATQTFWQYNPGALPTLKAGVTADIVFPTMD